MKFDFVSLGLSTLLLAGMTPPAFGQTSKTDVMAALNAGDTAGALDLAEALYADSLKSNDETSAGYAAYAKAQIYTLKKMPLESAKAYDECADHYSAAGSAAQSLQCRYQAGVSFFEAGKTGTASDVLKSAAKDLEKIGQDKSALAANVYLALAKTILPSKITGKQSAANKRKAAIESVDKALLALDSLGQKQTHLFASGLYIKGIALEDSKMFDEAAAVYKETIDISKLISETPNEFNKKLSTRYAIAKSHSSDAVKSDRFFIDDVNGNEVEFRVNKKRKIKIPRLFNNTMVDGAAVKAEITLGNDGSVTNIDIVESRPSAEYGEAFVKAIKTWEFIPVEDVPVADIPPFEYNLTFSVYRRD